MKFGSRILFLEAVPKKLCLKMMPINRMMLSIKLSETDFTLYFKLEGAGHITRFLKTNPDFLQVR